MPKPMIKKKMMTPEEMEAARIAEKKRVDEFYAKGQRERSAMKKPKEKEKEYPMGVRMMGPGFRNLYDSLRK
jgi:hypothetical protein